MNKAVIFDMDGVLINTEPLKFEAYQIVFKDKFGVNIKDDPQRLGRHEEAVMNLYLNKHDLQANMSELIAQKSDAYHKFLSEGRAELFPGVVDFLNSLGDGEFLIGLATSSDRESTGIILDKFHLRQYFESILAKEDIDKKKPAPDMYLKSAALLQVKTGDCVGIEDSVPGVKSVKSAGMKCIAVTNTTKKEKLGKADLIIESFDDLSVDVISQLLSS